MARARISLAQGCKKLEAATIMDLLRQAGARAR